MDEQNTAPISFNITFAGMLSLAIDMGLEFPIRQTDVHRMLHTREMELKRFVSMNYAGLKTGVVPTLCLQIMDNLFG